MNAQNVEESVVRYANGPIMAIGEHAPDDTFAVALFRSDFARKASSPIGVMKDSAAIIASNPPLQSGRGRVVLLSPHMEDGEPWTGRIFGTSFDGRHAKTQAKTTALRPSRVFAVVRQLITSV